MVLGSIPSSLEDPTPGHPTRRRQDSLQASKDKGDRKSKNREISKQGLHSSKERFPRREVDPRLVHSEHFHKVPQLQDVNSEGDQIVTTKEFLDNLPGSKRRLLARASEPHKEIIPNLPLEKPELAVQSNAIRPVRSSSHIHQGHSSRGESVSRRRDLVPPLSGRSVDSSLFKRRVRVPNKKSNRDHELPRLDPELQEISHFPSTSLHLARRLLRSQRPHSKHSNGYHVLLSESIVSSDFSTLHLSSRDNAPSRPSQLDQPSRPYSKANLAKNKKVNKVSQKSRFGHTSHFEQKRKTQSMQVDQGFPNPTKSRCPKSRHHHPDRRMSERLGISDRQQMLLGQLQQVNELLYKCSRNPHSLVLPPDGQGRGGNHSSPDGQQRSHSSHQEEHFPDISSLEPLRSDLEEGSPSKLDSHDLPYSGLLQCNSRPTVPPNGNAFRVVSFNNGLPEDPLSKPSTPSGPLCHTSQQQAPNIHLSLSRQQSSSSRLSDGPLEQMETSLSVPPLVHDFEGFSEGDGVQLRECNLNYSRHSFQTVVHVTGTPEDTFFSDSSPVTASSSRSVGHPTPSFQTSRVEAIKGSLAKKFPKCNGAIEVMAKTVRPASLSDYQQKYDTLMKYLKKNKISQDSLSRDCVFNFLHDELFIRRHLKPTTVEKYKTALTKPLLSRFGIDLRIEEAGDLIRGMKILRPNLPSQDPQWNLNKVLKFLDTVMPYPLSNENLLRKTAFLLLLASGMRVSELHACLRTEVSCRFTDDNYLQLSHHPLFLAKNESPTKRWKFKVIKPLVSQDGSPNKLCPVSSLKEYLNRPPVFKTGRLFRSANGAKELSKSQLSTEICKLIVQADPGTKAKVHDIRSYASSTALASTMITPSELADAIGWSSPETFFKFYRKAIEPLTREVSLPGPDPRGRSH